MKIEENVTDSLKVLLKDENRSPFSEDGFDAYIKNITSYLIILFNLSSFYAKKQGVSDISKIHIQKAAESLYKSRNEKFLKILLSISGILLGASISHFSTLAMNNNSYTLSSVLFIIISGFFGSILMGYYLTK